MMIPAWFFLSLHIVRHTAEVIRYTENIAEIISAADSRKATIPDEWHTVEVREICPN
jgi:hypothetical protein